ncbi:MAG: BLUF domain-containing protein [Pseudomonadota bacterium]
MLVEMIYASKVSKPLDSSTVTDILLAARRHNARHGLTGLLVFNHAYFLQVIEGDRSQLKRLLPRLMADQRHTEFALIRFASIAQRQYSNWSMGFVAAHALNRAVLLRHGVSDSFDPCNLTESAAIALLRDLRESLVAETLADAA